MLLTNAIIADQASAGVRSRRFTDTQPSFHAIKTVLDKAKFFGWIHLLPPGVFLPRSGTPIDPGHLCSLVGRSRPVLKSDGWVPAFRCCCQRALILVASQCGLHPCGLCQETSQTRPGRPHRLPRGMTLELLLTVASLAGLLPKGICKDYNPCPLPRAASHALAAARFRLFRLLHVWLPLKDVGYGRFPELYLTTFRNERYSGMQRVLPILQCT